MFRKRSVVKAWGGILVGRPPILSIEITRECPLDCPGCYAYGDAHLGGAVTLRELSDLRGDALVAGIVDLVRRHKPLDVSLVGGEPLIRVKELSRLLPLLAEEGITAMVVTSGVIAIPKEWMNIPGVRVAVSVDGLPEHHDVRRKPATYERILRNIEGCRVDLSWVITQVMMERRGYLDEYLEFWSARPEVNRIGMNIYTPQIGERSAEMLTPQARRELLEQLSGLQKRYPKFWMIDGVARAFGQPPPSPDDCTFAKLSVNHSADLKAQVQPCIFGGNPDCSQCGCGVTALLHHVDSLPVAGPLRASHLMHSSIAIGRFINRLRPGSTKVNRWRPASNEAKVDRAQTS
jgi:sulfatase maturation enzyme AslB (radical SAM superfamily)